MFVKSRITAVLALTASMNAAAASPSLFGSCDDNGECSAIFIRTLPEAKALCGQRTTSIAWRKNSKPILLQCVGSATDEEDNTSYVVNGVDVVGLNYGRYVKVDFLRQNSAASVAAPLGSLPFCGPADPEKLHNSAFVLLYKRPNENQDFYCYDVTYLSTTAGGVQLDTSAGIVAATNRTYFSGHTSNRTKQRVKELSQMFETWRDEQHY